MNKKIWKTGIVSLYGEDNYRNHINVGDQFWYNFPSTSKEYMLTGKSWNILTVTFIRSGVVFFTVNGTDVEFNFNMDSVMGRIIMPVELDPNTLGIENVEQYRFDDTWTKIINFDNSDTEIDEEPVFIGHVNSTYHSINEVIIDELNRAKFSQKDLYINEKSISNIDSNVGKSHTFQIDIEAASDEKAFLKGIEEVYGETGIHIENGKYGHVVFSCETLDDFLKVCGLISVAWNLKGVDSMMDYNGNVEDENDLAFYVPDRIEIRENIDAIEKYANLWIKWFKNNEFECK